MLIIKLINVIYIKIIILIIYIIIAFKKLRRMYIIVLYII